MLLKKNDNNGIGFLMAFFNISNLVYSPALTPQFINYSGIFYIKVLISTMISSTEVIIPSEFLALIYDIKFLTGSTSKLI